MFQLTREEFDFVKSQTAMSKPHNSSQFAMSSGKHRGAAYRPYAFTEHGHCKLQKSFEARAQCK
jgi:hypothetical protein